MNSFIIVPNTDKYDKPIKQVVNVEDISAIKPWPGMPGCIIERKSNPEFALWTTRPMSDIIQQLQHLGHGVEG